MNEEQTLKKQLRLNRDIALSYIAGMTKAVADDIYWADDVEAWAIDLLHNCVLRRNVERELNEPYEQEKLKRD